MFRGRLVIWILVIILCVGGTFLIDNIPKWMDTTEIAVSSQAFDNEIAENITNKRFGDYVVKSVKKNADIIISSTQDEISGYKANEGLLYSPLVLYVRNWVVSYNDGFIETGNNSNYKIDLMTVLRAMEQNKTWQDIGVNDGVVEGDIVLSIPDKNEWYYPEVEELFYIALNGDKTPSEAERATLKPRVEKLLEKCETIFSMQQALQEEVSNPSDKHKVFIAPECFYMTADGMDGHRSAHFIPVYFTKSTFVYANVHINNENIDLGEDFIKTIQTKHHFMDRTGWRISNSTFDIKRVTSFFIKVPV